MSNLNMTLLLEGREEELKLRFGKVSFLKYLDKVSDGYDFFAAQLVYDPGKLYKSVFYFIRASLIYQEVTDLKRLPLNDTKDPDELDNMGMEKITKRMVSDIADDLTMDQMMEVQRYAWAAMSGKTVEEIKAKEEEDKKNLSAQVNGLMEKVL